MKRVRKGCKRKVPFLVQSNLFITDTKGTGISGGVRFREIGFIRISASVLESKSELFVIERGVRNERMHRCFNCQALICSKVKWVL